MITLHGEEVKVGDKVWHWFKGWGEVTELDEKNSNYPICVQWEEEYEWYTKEGKFHTRDETPTLYWQPIEFEIPKKPKQKEKAWQWVYFDNQPKLYGITYSLYSSTDDFHSKYQRDRYTAIEPYLPSEIEREVKE